MAEIQANFTRPYLYPKQFDAIYTPKRWAYIEASTKSGKTVGCIAWLVEQAFLGKPGQNYWWVAPVASQADIAYRRIKQFLTKGSFHAFASPYPRVELFCGTCIWIKSGDNPDSLYGEDVYAAVLDEASRVKEESWYALRSTLTATRGPCRLIGNVKGRKNFFYTLARRAEKGEDPQGFYAKITALDAIEAGVLDQDEVDDARRNLPEQVFKELYLAEPADDGGNPFGLDHITACVGPLSSNPVTAWGIDLAKKQDYLVVIGLDSGGNVAGFHRWRGVPWRESIRRIHSIVGEDAPALADSTGVGDPVVEELQYEHGNFFGYNFSLSSKQKIMEGLSVSIQGHEIRFPDGPIRQELESFEYELTRTGVRYSAPEGYYDDCVCALALARQMWTESVPGANVSEYYINSAIRIRAESERESERGDRLPFKTGDTSEHNPDTELTQVYNAEVEALLPQERKICVSCGHEIKDLTIISDGEFYWHYSCTRSVLQAA